MRDKIENIYKKMVLIRNFEEKVLELFSKGLLFGTTHTSIGQEAIAVALSEHLIKRDIVVSNHRCHAHYLAITEDVYGLMAEIMGKDTGICGGRGGSQHLCKEQRFFTNGIQGGMVSFAVGLAFAKKHKNIDGIVVNFIGDGTFGQGIIYESFNLASLWKVPLLIVVEDNRYAQSTLSQTVQKGNFINKLKAFEVECDEIEGNNVIELMEVFKKAVEKVRTIKKPYAQVVHTYRLASHSQGDDFRLKEEIERWRKKDPLKIISKHIPKERRLVIQREAKNIINNATERAMSDGYSKELGEI